jgi:uncharacterized protein
VTTTRQEAPRAPGSFCWVGLLTPDVEGAKRFYGELFGWESADGATNDRPHSVLRLLGEDVALLYGISERQRALGAPTNWASFVSVRDVEQSAARTAAYGGALAIPPYEAAGAGRIAVVTDPGGARLSLWEPRDQVGARRRGPVGTCCWNELATADPEAAASFYADLFGWDTDREPSGYRIISNRGVAQGGIRPLRGAERARPHWLPYFRVGSVEETTRRCAAAGGRLADASYDGPVAVLQDASGASFGVCERFPSGSRREPAPPTAQVPDAAA